MKKVIHTTGAPEAIGPYSQAIKFKASDLLFCSGQIPLDPASGEMTTGSAAEQARRAMDNLKALLEASGFSMDDVVKATIYLTDLASFTDVNRVYEKYFSGNFPARSTIQVAALPRGAAVEIDMVACR
jgi:2-iminobutanoate/2-iminopropanoate deaminase